MGVLVALVVGLALWIVGFAIFQSPHSPFDWFLPTPLLVLSAWVGGKVAPYIRQFIRP